jgi:hypothetical protein
MVVRCLVDVAMVGGLAVVWLVGGCKLVGMAVSCIRRTPWSERMSQKTSRWTP